MSPPSRAIHIDLGNWSWKIFLFWTLLNVYILSFYCGDLFSSTFGQEVNLAVVEAPVEEGTAEETTCGLDLLRPDLFHNDFLRFFGGVATVSHPSKKIRRQANLEKAALEGVPVNCSGPWFVVVLQLEGYPPCNTTVVSASLELFVQAHEEEHQTEFYHHTLKPINPYSGRLNALKPEKDLPAALREHLKPPFAFVDFRGGIRGMSLWTDRAHRTPNGSPAEASIDNYLKAVRDMYVFRRVINEIEQGDPPSL
jgi:hypothetical protein